MKQMKTWQSWMVAGFTGIGLSASAWSASADAKTDTKGVDCEMTIGSKPISPADGYFERAKEVSVLFSVNAVKPVVGTKAVATSGTADVDTKAAAKTREQLLRSMLAENKTLTIESLLKCIDSRIVSDVETRKGALKAIEFSEFRHATLSKYIASVAVVDPVKEVRETAVTTIKNRKDDPAIGNMTQFLMGSYDEGGKVLDATLRDNAVDALRGLGDKRVYQTLLYYATCEIRSTNTELGSFATRQIDAIVLQNGASAVLPLALSFPIQFPELKISKVRTTVKCPAVNALESLSNQKFGDDLDRWGKWIDKQK
jgi:HEAT repeat protein